MSYSVVNIDEIEPAGPGGAVRFVRRATVNGDLTRNSFVSRSP